MGERVWVEWWGVESREVEEERVVVEVGGENVSWRARAEEEDVEGSVVEVSVVVGKWVVGRRSAQWRGDEVV